MKTLFKLVAALPMAVSLGATSITAAESDIASIAPVQNIFPNAFGSVMLRHYNEKTEGGKGVRAQARYYLGSTFFDDMLKSQFIFGVVGQPNTTKLKKRNVEFENFLTVFENDYLKLYPYLLVTAKDDATDTELAVVAEPEYNVSTGVGEFGVFGLLKVGGYSSSKADKAQVQDAEDDTAAALFLTQDDDGAYTTDAKSNRMFTYTRTGVSFKPRALPALKVAYRTEHTSEYAPRHTLNEQKNRVVVEKNGAFPRYDESYKREHVFTARYKVSDTLEAKNEFFLRERFENKAQYENVFSLTAEIF